MVGLLTMTLPMFTSSASAVQATYLGLGEGLWVTGNDGVRSQAMVQNTTVGPTWCVDYYVAVFPGDVLDEVPLTEGVGGELTIENLRTIYRIVLNSYPNENPAFPLEGNNDQKAAAIQSAIWSFSNPGWELDRVDVRNPQVLLDNYDKIRGWVDGDAANGEYPTYPSDPQASLSVDPENATGEVGTVVGPYTVNLVGGSVNVTVTGGTLVDSSGNALDPATDFSDGDQFYITSDSEGTVTATVAGEVVAPPGSVYFAPLKQRLVGISEGEGETEVQVSAQFTPTTTTTSTTVEPVPTVQGTSVTRVPAVSDPGVKVAGTSVSATGALPTTGADRNIFYLGFTLMILGGTLLSLKKLSTVYAR